MGMKPSTNEAVIEGYLSEKITRDFEDGAIAGELVIEVPLSVDGGEVSSLIPVSFYTKPVTNAGKPNPAYKGIKTIIDDAVALHDVDGDYSKATRIRLRNGTLGENMFFSQDDRFVTFARVRGNFFDRVRDGDFNPKAQFKVKMIIAEIKPEEITQEGDTFETGRLIVVGQIVQYNGKIDEIKFLVENQKHIDFITKNWNVDDTVNAQGLIKFVSKEVEVSSGEEDGFGEPMITTETRRVREFIITNGSSGAVEGYEEKEIFDARKERKVRIAEIKEEQAEKAKASAKKNTAKDTGF